MSREIDRRDFTVNRTTSTRKAALAASASRVSDGLPGGHRIRITRFDAVTGNPSRVVSDSAPAEKGRYVQRALEHVRGIGGALGLEAAQAPEFVADPTEQKTTGGAVAVHLQQLYKGIPIFQAAETVRFAPDGRLTETTGSRVTVAGDLPVAPRLSVQEAVRRAAEHVAVPHPDEMGARDSFGEPMEPAPVDLTDFAPKVVATFPNVPEQPTVLEAGPFGDRIKASLLWFALPEELRLAWEVLVTMPKRQGQYRTLVDAESGEILYCRQLMQFAAARGNVYRVDGSTPRQMTDFPRPVSEYGLPPTDLPPGFPDPWVHAQATSGNSVNAHLDQNGPNLDGIVEGGVLTFDPTNPTGDDQKILNIFYFNGVMHDYLYLLGFREEDGNFQQDNLGRGGLPGDPVDARAHSGAVWGTANMGTPVDGRSPEMNMGLVASTRRHTAFDSSVVFHEFMHGVTNRLVGGPMDVRALDAPQSGGMGEGWGDYLACTINNGEVVGAWVVNRPGGIRGFPYDEAFPDHFGMLGTGRYTEVHNIGEIWCATLMAINRRIGATLGIQLVVDALKLSPANPSFLDMRDAILAALDAKIFSGHLSAAEGASARTKAWAAFAKFGMGPNARSNGASLSGIAADFSEPPQEGGPADTTRVEVSPNRPIPDNRSTGVRSTLDVAKAGRVRRLSVWVDIEHTYIGDLEATLRSPGGTSALLHNRAGASANNLVKTYTSDDTPALTAFLGEDIQGTWTLKVADLAPRDVGTLTRWGLELVLEPPVLVVGGRATPRLSIPDADPAGVSSTISVAEHGTARTVKVSVDITHTYVGDIRVVLVSPSGSQVVLHEQVGGSQDNLIVTYDSASNASLASLVGESVHGDWVLRVADLVGQDIGKLNRWSLEVTL